VPSEIEAVLGQLPEVIECKVYAGQHRDGNQFVKAAIVAEPSVDLTRVRSHCASHLVYYKRPERFYRLDALPRSPAGKILKDQLP
jgi:acyl-CoA synthetase (AMP-forming)/AMP-acid ligase II